MFISHKLHTPMHTPTQYACTPVFPVAVTSDTQTPIAHTYNLSSCWHSDLHTFVFPAAGITSKGPCDSRSALQPLALTYPPTQNGQTLIHKVANGVQLQGWKNSRACMFNYLSAALQLAHIVTSSLSSHFCPFSNYWILLLPTLVLPLNIL